MALSCSAPEDGRRLLPRADGLRRVSIICCFRPARASWSAWFSSASAAGSMEKTSVGMTVGWLALGLP